MTLTDELDTILYVNVSDGWDMQLALHPQKLFLFTPGQDPATPARHGRTFTEE